MYETCAGIACNVRRGDDGQRGERGGRFVQRREYRTVARADKVRTYKRGSIAVQIGSGGRLTFDLAEYNRRRRE